MFEESACMKPTFSHTLRFWNLYFQARAETFVKSNINVNIQQNVGKKLLYLQLLRTIALCKVHTTWEQVMPFLLV